jgi:catechol 2,3-dioxygenase-like lactoylglutathione lyase family enzyme
MACCPPSSPASSAAPATAPPLATLASPTVHVHLHVRDLEAHVHFYRLLFGSEPVKLLPGYAKFLPSWGPLNLALSQSAADERGSVISHLGIQLTSPAEVRREHARVAACGLPVRLELGADCCHANADKFWVVDPAGIEWEIYHLNYDRAPALAAGASVCTTSCCPA